MGSAVIVWKGIVLLGSLVSCGRSGVEDWLFCADGVDQYHVRCRRWL